MNFGLLKSEVLARGFDFQDSVRVGRWVNQAHQELCNQEVWPFTLATATGAVPLAIADLGVIRSVRSSAGYRLDPVEFGQLAHDETDLSRTGKATCYFRTDVGLSVFPVDTSPVTVTYWRSPADMVADGDTPIPPAQYHELIVLGALRRAALEESDGPDYGSFDAEWQRGLQTMRERELLWHRDGNMQMLSTADHGDS